MSTIKTTHLLSKPIPVALRLLVFLFFCMAALWSGCGSRVGGEEKNYAECADCHQGIESISPNHEMPCTGCHLPGKIREELENPSGPGILSSHRVIIRNPSDPAHWRSFCLPCHQDEIQALENSLHGSMAGVINQTRYLWGAQERAAPAVYGLSGPFEPLPEVNPEVYPDRPDLLVDDFLRRRCLRCHVHTTGAGGPGLYRASGCAACHVIYRSDGRYRGADPTLDRSEGGHPARHAFTRFIPNEQCLHCHNGNRVGADYEGLFQHDFNRTYRSPRPKGEPPPRLYGLDHHRLTRDVHAERGLLCIDCHTKKDVMGDGSAPSHALEKPLISCEDCHGGFRGAARRQQRGGLLGKSSGAVVRSGNQDRKHPVPPFTESPIPHQIQAHSNVRCSACHSLWSFQDYGMSVIREDVLEGYKWYFLSAQGDPSLEEVLRNHLERGGKSFPSTKDWISGEKRPGIWSVGWRFRRWEQMTLGVDHTGRVAILRPFHQYLVSYVDRLGQPALDSEVPQRGDKSGRGWAFSPYVPHTIGPAGRSCDNCHGNRLAAGLGLEGTPTQDTRLTIPSAPAVSSMHLLDDDQRDRLMEPSRSWAQKRLEALTGKAEEPGSAKTRSGDESR